MGHQLISSMLAGADICIRHVSDRLACETGQYELGQFDVRSCCCLIDGIISSARKVQLHIAEAAAESQWRGLASIVMSSTQEFVWIRLDRPHNIYLWISVQEFNFVVYFVNIIEAPSQSSSSSVIQPTYLNELLTTAG